MINKMKADIVIVGGGLGGVSAALSAARIGARVIMTEESDWIGGQLTSQAVPPDEHPWIEQFGCTASYREFRNRVREYYRRHYPLNAKAAANPTLNPGNGWVSRLAHEPKVALRVLQDMLAPYVNGGRVSILLNTRPIEVIVEGDECRSLIVEQIDIGGQLELIAPMYLDATELGELLPLGGIEHVTGAEARSETGEPHAMEQADPLDMQSITHVFAVDYVEGGNFTINMPEMYNYWRSFIPSFSQYPILDWKTMDPHNPDRIKEYTMFPNKLKLVSLWDYRRIFDPSQLAEPHLYDGEVTLVNWPQNDYFVGPIIGVSQEEKDRHLYQAKQLSLSLLYWLQTEAPRLDGGKGYPGVRPRGDVLGTVDGLAKTAYIRESRRIRARYTITENDVSREARGSNGIRTYEDSVGIGSYHLDLHPTTISQRGFYIPSVPYEIPLGALLPIRVRNLLPACKNIGTTQVSNGCYRLHPTEWNIGEAAGALAAFAVKRKCSAHDVQDQSDLLQAYLKQLDDLGVERHWPNQSFWE
ncbi:FAD-dependent oxidoreductase [Paenibacillus albus]|uniref:FAD-dependent oxidoreductase n=1 Tax=Paenibacillus albus TaxID=2495582 RepID=A0A3Q8X6W1_9BACL|nr:FAD-dependent oxidoreductase [Paenibacillus albus]AZN41706.1 FAD-dependent oxidoreductase [Paenibacillus albus]